MAQRNVLAQQSPGPAPKAPSPRQRRLARQKRRHARDIAEKRLDDRRAQQQAPPLPPALPLSPAADSSLDCPHFASCSGCALESGLNRPPIFEEAFRFFAEECGFPSLALSAGPAQQWRHRARLAVRPGANGSAVVGLFGEGSHDVVPIPRCVVHHPAINQVVQLLTAALSHLSIRPYDEATGQGELRYVQLTVVGPPDIPGSTGSGSSSSDSSSNSRREDAAGGAAALEPGLAASAEPEVQVQLALVWNAAVSNAAPGSPPAARLEALASQLWQLAGRQEREQLEPSIGLHQQQRQEHKQQQQGQPPPAGLLHSVWANFQPARTNTILGTEWQLLQGEEEAWVRLGGADICFGPGSFMQANPGAMERALAAMQRHVPPEAALADLHAGVGTIGLSLAAARGPRSVRFVEISGLGRPAFRRSAARLQERLGAGGAAGTSLPDSSGGAAAAAPELSYIVAAAGSDPARWCRGAEVVILDPPRKGLEPSLLDWLCSPAAAAAGVRRLLYLSCGFPALRRDCASLLGSGRWRLEHAEAFLFFPGADHIETLCVFDACSSVAFT